MMPHICKDIWLVNDDVNNLTKIIKEYLNSTGFETKEEISQEITFIQSNNKINSNLRLIWSSIQIVNIYLIKKEDSQVQIEIGFNLFNTLKIFYYLFFYCLLFISFSLNKMNKYYFSADMAEKVFYFFLFGILPCIILLMIMFLCLRLINPNKYELFLNNLSDHLATNGIKQVIILKDRSKYSLAWPVFLNLIIVPSILLIDKDYYNIFLSNLTLTLYAFSFLLVLALMFFLMFFNKRAHFKYTFCILGICSSYFFLIYSNLSIFNWGLKGSLKRTYFLYKMTLTQEKEIHFMQRQSKNQENNKTKYTNKISYELMNRMQNASFAFLAAMLILLSLLFFSLLSRIMYEPIKLIRALNKLKFDKHNDHLLKPETKHEISNILIVIFWIVTTIGIYYGVYNSFSLVEQIIFGTTSVFKSNVATLFFDETKIIFFTVLYPHINDNNIAIIHKLIIFLYTSPVLIFILLILKKNWRLFRNSNSLIKNNLEIYSDAEIYLNKIVREICSSFNIRTPIVRIVISKDINAESRYLGLPFFKHILIVTSMAWDELSNKTYELEALLAHEICHIKNHTIKKKLLCLLSDYSLFGNGFLTIVQDSFHLEKDADYFAANWLKAKLKEKITVIHILEELLKAQENIKLKNFIKKKYFNSGASNSGASMSFGDLTDQDYRESIIKRYDCSSKAYRFWMNIKLLYSLYFGEINMSYFHPLNSQRLEWIKASETINE